MALIHPDQIVIRRESQCLRARACWRFSPPTAAAASCAFRSTSAAAQIEAMPWVEQATRAPRRCRIASKSKSPSARPSPFCARASDMALVDAHGVILDRPLEGEFPFSGRHGDQRRHAARRSRAAHAAFLRLLAADRIRASGRDRSGERSRPLGRARLRATLTGLQRPMLRRLPARIRRARGHAPMRRSWCISATAISRRKYQTLVDNIGAVARQRRAASNPWTCVSAAKRS